MKSLSLVGVLLLLVVVFTSCEVDMGCSGTVRSAQTLMPIRGARVQLLRNGWPGHSTITDSAGYFKVNEFVGIPTFGDGPRPGLLIHHPGYQPLYLPNANRDERRALRVDSLNLYLERYPDSVNIIN